jgi:ABC-type amino acid transport system permease subunit
VSRRAVVQSIVASLTRDNVHVTIAAHREAAVGITRGGVLRDTGRAVIALLAARAVTVAAHVELTRGVAALTGAILARTVIALLVGLAWWYVFHRYPRWYGWFAGAVPFLVVLFFFYTYLEQLLPANY